MRRPTSFAVLIGCLIGGCGSFGGPVTGVPIQIGPVARIGGGVSESSRAVQSFSGTDGITQRDFNVKSTEGQSEIDKGVGSAMAEQAGKTRLRRLLPRADKLSIGAWVYFLIDTWSSRWVQVDGSIVEVQQ